MDTFLIQTNKQITFKKRKTENGEKRSWTQGVERALQRSSQKNIRATVSNATRRFHVTFEETGGERGRDERIEGGREGVVRPSRLSTF